VGQRPRSLNGAPRTLQLKGRRRDGQQFPVEASVSRVEAEEGELVSAALRDTGAQLSVSRFAGAFDHAPVAMTLVSTDGHWLAANQAASVRVSKVNRRG
jgi:PAS domain-containing protein